VRFARRKSRAALNLSDMTMALRADVRGCLPQLLVGDLGRPPSVDQEDYPGCKMILPLVPPSRNAAAHVGRRSISGDETLAGLKRGPGAGKFFLSDCLKMGLVLDARPITTPFKMLFFPDGASALVQFRFRNILAAFEDANIPSDAEVMVALSTAGIGDNRSRLGASLGEEIVLLFVGTRS
jgi:hypothetical protein